MRIVLRFWCWVVGHDMIEDPGIDGEPLYYPGFRPYCGRCGIDVDALPFERRNS